MVKARLPLLRLTPLPEARINLKNSNGTHCQDIGCSSAGSKSDPEALQQHRPSAVTPNLIHSPDIFIGLCIFCVCACTCGYMWMKKKKKSGKGPEKAVVSVGTTGSQQGDWLYKQAFTTLEVWLQYSPTGDTECGTETDREWMTHICIISSWQRDWKRFTSLKKTQKNLTHYPLTLSDLQIFKDNRPCIDVV